MKRFLEFAGLAAGTALALVAGTAWDHWVRWAVMIALGALLVGIAGAVIRRRVREFRLGRMRGVVSIGRDHYRQRDYARVWEEAQRHVLCMGLAMTHVTANLDQPKGALARGVRVDFLMLDPDWIQRNRSLARAMNQYYGNRRDIISATRSSYGALMAFAEEMNQQYGEHSVRVSLFREISLISATLSDAKDGDVKGVVEFHLFQGNLNRIRLHVRDMPKARMKPVVADVNESLRRLMPPELGREVFGGA
ncbi:MAG TPA: hypothetical protein VFU12_00175 [Glycomyces sp.]|nr:hypothetical protein [Glycomyces sp.]